MPFDHNDHYHRLLLRQLPPGARRALDVGCGTGTFARRLARRGVDVDAVDRDAGVITAARGVAGTGRPGLPGPPGLPGRVNFRQADVAALSLPPGTYDYISCLASLHHLPLDTLRTLRDALAPGGVLVVLGCYREASAWDRVVSLAAVPVNAVCRVGVFVRERSVGRAVSRASVSEASVSPPSAPTMAPAGSFAEVRAYAAEHLPGHRMRRLLFWRYLLVHRTPSGPR
ncbi:bifunctional 2-polyprenyl-6-hydroxyphenol methylase/3-demethylubiquinol 3-O-methyltransferase UbiG [Kitasatospora aureofaciens]|uniref:class I SAM-dependent methyltransferase n=1 Tax=Kitasatospora aureofaciens TaxID=1894 RepID=UPI001C472890|nr:class I SAM-dependent methyltransferase [Kitasatospora aureofaciens]MBV6701010.1 class I SAM-dependent methyltransferase [Kitasatospora aureofaciens]